EVSSFPDRFFHQGFSHVHRLCSTGPPFPESRPPGHGGPGPERSPGSPSCVTSLPAASSSSPSSSPPGLTPLPGLGAPHRRAPPWGSGSRTSSASPGDSSQGGG